NERLVSGSTYAELLASSFEHIGTRLIDSANDGLPDPVLGTALKPDLEYWQWTSAGQTFERLAREAREALDAERCRAAKLWRDILGDNDRGPILPLPDGCDAGGFPVGAVTAVGALGSNQPRSFAMPAPHRDTQR
ncbi:nucleotidyltransferase, partial [Mycobacterium paraffinicum]